MEKAKGGKEKIFESVALKLDYDEEKFCSQ